MQLLNLALSLIGFFGWCWVWWCNRYKTGRTMRTQVGVILLGLFWVMLFIADTYEHLNPTPASFAGRFLMIIALWCLMPLLRAAPCATRQDEQT